jgi:hypothetical protein
LKKPEACFAKQAEFGETLDEAIVRELADLGKTEHAFADLRERYARRYR